jgi:alpha-galactosidase
VGYFKFDYNLDITQGTDLPNPAISNSSTSPFISSHVSHGSGLLEHNRAYLAWANCFFTRFPQLVIENCSSGGQRMDYAMLSVHPLQSTSDQEDAVFYAYISASWAYPQPGWDDEKNAPVIMNSLLGGGAFEWAF